MSETAKVETMAKGDFARLVGVTPGRVSQYIAEGKIFGEAIEGEGRLARIRPEIAQAQLYKSLEPSQRLGGNGAAIRSQAEPASSLRSAAEPVHDELAAERLKQQRMKTAQLERAEALEAGRYMLAEDARREMGRAVSEAFKIMDQGMREMSTALAAEFGVNQREAHQVMVKAFRDVRAQATFGFRADATVTPALVADQPDDMQAAS